MITWKNMDTLAAYAELQAAQKINLAAAMSAHNQMGIPVFSIYGRDVQDMDDNSVPEDVREKLLRYFTLQSAKRGEDSFELPFSLSALADYISTDRSAMMRELKRLREDGMVSSDGREFTLYQ